MNDDKCLGKTGQADTEGPHVYDDCQISRAWISLLYINQEEIYK
jgi:hypothetical protein